MLSGSDPVDFPELLKLVPAGSRERSLLLDCWIKRDATGLLDEWRTQFDELGKAESYDLGAELWYRWFQQDQGAAMAAVDQLVRESEGRYLQGSVVLEELVDIDPKKAIRLISAYLPAFESDIIGYQWARLIGEEPEDWASFLSEHSAGVITENGLGEVGRIWGAQDARAAMEFVEEVHGRSRDRFQKSVFRTWGQVDLSASHQWFFEQESARLRNELRPILLENWAQYDLSAAANWGLTYFQGAQLRSSIQGLATGASVKGIEAVQQLWGLISDPQHREVLISKAQEVWQIDQAQTVWSRSLTPEESAWLQARKVELSESVLPELER